MNNMNLRPLTEAEMKETGGGSILGILFSFAVGWAIGVMIYAFATSDGKCDCESAD
jgi:hypothetical protein